MLYTAFNKLVRRSTQPLKNLHQPSSVVGAYMNARRSISIDGNVTSISMESIFWDELERRAMNNQQSWQDLSRNIFKHSGGRTKRSSALRIFLFEALRNDVLRIRKRRLESWWIINSPSGTQEIGTRSSLLLVGRNTANDIVIDDDEIS
jgi:predicted DNA-binding ribbon-helix-helix protein